MSFFFFVHQVGLGLWLEVAILLQMVGLLAIPAPFVSVLLCRSFVVAWFVEFVDLCKLSSSFIAEPGFLLPFLLLKRKYGFFKSNVR